MSENVQQATMSPADDRARSAELFTALYQELHRLAHRELHRNGGRLSISTTAVLHEAYLKLSNRDGVHFPDPQSFLSYAGRAMRGLVIDAVRRRCARKRGGQFEITRLETEHEDNLPAERELTSINDALQSLEVLDPPLAELVDLHYYCGLSLPEISALRGVSERTTQRHWEKARLMLFNLLTEGEE